MKPEKKYSIVDQNDNCQLIRRLISILEKDYVMVKVSPAKADYLFHFIKGSKVLRTNGIRIFVTGENITPDFNISDYAIGFDYIHYLDRYIRIPLYFFYEKAYQSLLMPRKDPKMVLNQKKGFCSYVMSNTKNSSKERLLIHDAIAEYKMISNGGRWNNNVGGKVRNKINFQAKYKFALAIENSSSMGYCTEKFVQAAQSDCIPIYWGDPTINQQFNPKSFVNVHDYSSLEDLKKAIMNIDSNDEKYFEMLNQPWVINNINHHFNLDRQLYLFLKNIFDQPLEAAYRRNRSRWGKKYLKRRIR